MTRREAVALGASKLVIAGVENSWFEAQLLMAAVLGIDTVDILAHGDKRLTTDELKQYQQAVGQRQKRKPLAYITGKKPFLHWEFNVNEDVLIPRPETEVLVELAVHEVSQRFPGSPLQIADIGTGSGAIGLSMLALLPTARLAAVDLSEPALLVARENAELLNVQDRVSLYPGDLLGPLESWREAGFHCVTANLPYVADAEYQDLQPEVSRYEPRAALVSGADGLRHYRHLLRDVREFLLPKGLVFIEIGSTQAEQVCKLFVHGGFSFPKVEKDLAGKCRVVWASKD